MWKRFRGLEAHLMVLCSFLSNLCRFILDTASEKIRRMTTTVALTTQSSPAAIPPSVFTLPHTAQLEALYTIIRDINTSRGDFLFYSDRIIRLLVEEGLNHLPVVSKTVETPTVGLNTLSSVSLESLTTYCMCIKGRYVRGCRF